MDGCGGSLRLFVNVDMAGIGQETGGGGELVGEFGGLLARDETIMLAGEEE